MDKVAIVDVDDTIGQLRYTLADIIDELTTEKVDMAQWDCHELDKVFNVSFDDVFDIMIDRESLLNLKPEPFSRDMLRELKTRGYHIDIVTARAWHPDGYGVTKEWLNKFNLPHDDITVVPLSECKAETLKKKYKNVRFTVDDNPKHCQAYVDSDIVDTVYLVDRTWNRKLTTGVKRITCLSEITKELQQ